MGGLEPDYCDLIVRGTTCVPWYEACEGTRVPMGSCQTSRSSPDNHGAMSDVTCMSVTWVKPMIKMIQRSSSYEQKYGVIRCLIYSLMKRV